jgi:hypothetical protein
MQCSCLHSPLAFGKATLELQRQINAVGTSVAACAAFFAGVWHLDMPTAIFSDDFPVRDPEKLKKAPSK